MIPGVHELWATGALRCVLIVSGNALVVQLLAGTKVMFFQFVPTREVASQIASDLLTIVEDFA
jgi:hypothetical protein